MRFAGETRARDAATRISLISCIDRRLTVGTDH
jgi:hypothetical protein